MSVPQPTDWQTSRSTIKERGQYLLETAMWSDCRFIVGTEPNQQVMEGHKLFLAMSSPVFEAMFYGGMPEKDPIAILDVQPDAFRALLEYIYTDKINLVSFDQACELCYGAKKYMLPHLVEECTKYLWSDLYPKNACRAYEFAKLFEEPTLMEKCIRIICDQTIEVLVNNSFYDVELSTILTIFDQEELNINSELDLFTAIARYASRHNQNNESDNSGSSTSTANNVNAPNNGANNTTSSSSPTIKDAIMKIRFLTLTPKQFAEVPANSPLLTQAEKYAILMNICSTSAPVPLPEGFTASRVPRRKKNYDCLLAPVPGSSMDTSRTSMIKYNSPSLEGGGEPAKRLYCTRQLLRITECMNTSVLDCALTFSCDKNICITGIQVPAQIPVDEDRQQCYSYPELLYAHLLDADGSRLTYTHFTSRVNYRSLIDISFNRPVYIQRNKLYKVGVVLNKVGCYLIGSYPNQTHCHGVVFNFSEGQNGEMRDGLIRSIIFSLQPVFTSSITSFNSL